MTLQSLFSNAALAAVAALKQDKINKVCIFDWDVHHGNGTQDIINNNPDMPWNWEGISMNNNITTDDVRNNIDNPWNYTWLSSNVNIECDFITKHSLPPFIGSTSISPLIFMEPLPF